MIKIHHAKKASTNWLDRNRAHTNRSSAATRASGIGTASCVSFPRSPYTLFWRAMMRASARSGACIPILLQIHFMAPRTEGITVGPQPRSAKSRTYFTSTSVVNGMALMFCDLAQVSRRSQWRTHCWMVLNPPLSYTIERRAFIFFCESGDPGLGPPEIVACSPHRSTIALSLMPHFLASPVSRALSDA